MFRFGANQTMRARLASRCSQGMRLKPERVDHLTAAVVCHVITFVAIIWSVVTALPYFL